MFAFARRSQARCGCYAILVGSALSIGCLRSFTDAPLKLPADESTASERAELPSLEALEERLSVRATRRDPVTKKETVERTDGWYRRYTADDPWIAPAGEFRWQHDALSSLVDDTDDDPAALNVAARSKDPLVRATAVIGLERLEPGQHASALLKVARDQQLPLNSRRAAIETLGSAQAIKTEALLRQLIEQFGPTDEGPCLEPLLYAEALVGLARHCAADAEPLFREALQTQEIDVQLAALAVFAAAKSELLPAEVRALAKSEHARVRKAALAALVAGQDPQAIASLRTALQDADTTVQVGAIELLGKSRDQEAVMLLHDLARDPRERQREAAVAALVAQAQWQAVERAAQDESFRVRQAVAIHLAAHGDATRVVLMRQLTKDSSAMVQAKACEALAKWPAELAVPLLIDALGSPNLLTRQTAHQSLLSHKVACEGFNAGAPPPERTQYVSDLRSRWEAEHPELAKASDAAALGTATSTAEEVTRLVNQYQKTNDRSERWLAQRQLERLGPPALAALETAVERGELKLAENTNRELLPQLSSRFAQIEKLRQGDASQRRAAARTLASGADDKDPLTPLAVARLNDALKSESDPLVLTEALRAAASAKDAVAHELALAALAHSDSDVKRRACEYLILCGDQRQSQALAPLVMDRDSLVVRAAVAALGRCGPPRSREDVHSLISHRDLSMQILAAQTLAKWDDPRGPAALERLAKAKFAATRRLAIAAMSELATDEFVPTLIEALDDTDNSVQIAALAALPKVAGENALEGHSPAPVSSADRARVWRNWYADRR